MTAADLEAVARLAAEACAALGADPGGLREVAFRLDGGGGPLAFAGGPELAAGPGGAATLVVPVAGRVPAGGPPKRQIAPGVALGKALCEAVGLDPGLTAGLSLHVAVGGAVTMEVKRLVTAEEAEGVARAAESFGGLLVAKGKIEEAVVRLAAAAARGAGG